MLGRWSAIVWCWVIGVPFVSPARADCFLLSSSARPMLNWYTCLHKSADIFSGEPEPASIVADAAFAKCLAERRAYDIALGGPGCYQETEAMGNMLRRQLIAHILTNRAEKRLVPRSKQPNHPRHDYNRM